MVPDLSLWRRAAAILSLLLLAVTGVVLAVGAPPSQAFYAFNMQRLREFRATHDPRAAHTLRVVMLGNSRLKNGTIDVAQIEQRASQYGYTRIEYFRLVANWAVFRDFAPLLDQVRVLRPDVYVVQMDLLVEDMAPAYEAQLAFNYLRWLTAGQGPWSWYEPQGEQLGLVCTNEGEPEARAARAAQKLTSDPDSESPRMARAFIQEVASDGTEVLLVTVPKSAAFERVSPSVNDQMLTAAREIAAELPSVTVAPFADSLPDDHFCDVTHLNRQGAAAFSRWLVGQIATAEVAELR
jgi:hypothetical protein